MRPIQTLTSKCQAICAAERLDAQSPVDFTLLTSYGMMAVELIDASGSKVQLAEGKLATLSFPIPEAARASAPQEIPLWHFSEAGVWVEEGFAERRGNMYVGEVSHFTFWNCDIPTQAIELCGRVVFEALARGGVRSRPLAIGIESSRWGSRRSYVDSTGAVCGLVPANEPLILRVYGNVWRSSLSKDYWTVFDTYCAARHYHSDISSKTRKRLRLRCLQW